MGEWRGVLLFSSAPLITAHESLTFQLHKGGRERLMLNLPVRKFLQQRQKLGSGEVALKLTTSPPKDPITSSSE